MIRLPKERPTAAPEQRRRPRADRAIAITPAAPAIPSSKAQAAIAARFHDGTTDLEVAQSIICGEVVCLLVVERTKFNRPAVTP